MLALKVYGLEEIFIQDKDKDGDILIAITNDEYSYTYINDYEAKLIIEELQKQIKDSPND